MSVSSGVNVVSVVVELAHECGYAGLVWGVFDPEGVAHMVLRVAQLGPKADAA